MKAMAKRQKTSVLIPASYPGEVSPDEAVAARSFFVLKITLFASDGAGQKSIAEQRSAYFLSNGALQDAIEEAQELGWGVQLEITNMRTAQTQPEPPTIITDGALPQVVVTAENLYEALMAEYIYWRDSASSMGVFASGALANVIAFATVEDWRADWHPEKVPPGQPAQPEKPAGAWLRFMFRLADPKERGLMGLILGRLLFDEGLATFVEPWPGDDVAVYVRDEAENVKQVLAVTKAAGLTPVGFVKTEGL